jgi:hypothetical protein
MSGAVFGWQILSELRGDLGSDAAHIERRTSGMADDREIV